MGNRKAAESYILDNLKALKANDTTIKLYVDKFKKMTNAEFEEFMGTDYLPIIEPVGSASKISVENNFAVAKKIGYDFFQHLRISATADTPEYITPNKYLIFRLPIKRAAQTLDKKKSIPDDTHSIDIMTGQVTTSSKASKLTMPEIQILVGLGLKATMVEFMKTRGGDLGEATALDNLIYRDGMVTQAALAEYQTGVVSTKVLKQFFLGMHIRSTL